MTEPQSTIVQDNGAAQHAPGNDIKIEYHPQSYVPDQIDSFETLFMSEQPSSRVPSDFAPWYPFGSRLDYEVSEFALRAGLNRNLTENLIDLLQQSSTNPHTNSFTIQSYDEMQQLWDSASFKSPEVRIFLYKFFNNDSFSHV